MSRNRRRRTRTVADVRGELLDDGKITQSGSGTIPERRFKYLKMTEPSMSQPTPPRLPDIRDVPALLLTALRGDETGARVLVEASDPIAMVFAVAAWANNMHGRADFDDEAAYIAYIEQVAAAMAAEDAGGTPGTRRPELGPHSATAAARSVGYRDCQHHLRGPQSRGPGI
jgi:hypothetical protein